jgi:hypothetical protein
MAAVVAIHHPAAVAVGVVAHMVVVVVVAASRILRFAVTQHSKMDEASLQTTKVPKNSTAPVTTEAVYVFEIVAEFYPIGSLKMT